jgi:endonuclease YncB( thermonuclease family)
VTRKALKTRKPGAGLVSNRQYERLLAQLRDLLEEGRWRAEQAIGQELVRTYHAVGKRLVAQKLSGRAGYGTATLQRLADDLGVAARILQQAMVFARLYSEGPPESGLRWAHYRELLRLTDAGQRGWYEEQAVKHDWPASKLIEAVREQRYRNQAGEEQSPTKRKPRKQLRRPKGATYVYKATIERVVDGDTLIAVVDLGFQVLKRQRLRLASIDTPELGTRKGDRARELLQHELARVDFVILKTDKIDLYGRYVAHVFYAPGQKDKQRIFAEGEYLNQWLVDEGVAKAL